jgi:hypothetical protein
MIGFNKYDSTIDSRDVIERIEELQAEREEDESNFTAADDEELAELEELADEASSSPDWEYGEALINADYFTQYAQELAEDCYEISSEWPFRCIDWEQAARELKMDYFSVDFGSQTFYIRA